jgi:tetratricopeptide (TPR) repeat protein
VRTFNTQGNKNRIRRFEAAGRDLSGEYGKALESLRLIRYRKKKLKNAADTRLLYYCARTGDLPAAEALLPACEARIAEAMGDGRAFALHAQGLYRLETGDLQKARDLLEDALNSAQRNGTLQGIRFDLARLEEKEGDAAKASEYYKQAAATGAKTWMGQEAARRAEALETGVHEQDVSQQSGQV